MAKMRNEDFILFYFSKMEKWFLNITEGTCLCSMLSIVINGIVFSSDTPGFDSQLLFNTVWLLDEFFLAFLNLTFLLCKNEDKDIYLVGMQEYEI